MKKITEPIYIHLACLKSRKVYKYDKKWLNYQKPKKCH